MPFIATRDDDGLDLGARRLRHVGVCEVGPTQPWPIVKGMLWQDTDATGSSVSSTVNLVTKTGAYTLTASDVVVLADGTFTLTLPTAVGIAGKMYYIKNIGTGVITVDGDGSETIDGGATAVLTDQYTAITIISDNTEWWIL